MKPLVWVTGPSHLDRQTDAVAGLRRATEVSQALLRTGEVVPLPAAMFLAADLVSPMEHDELHLWMADLMTHCDAVLRVSGDSETAGEHELWASVLDLPVFHAGDDLLAWAREDAS